METKVQNLTKKTAKGTRDMLPDQMAIKEEAITVIK